jgi:GNAT superfamily N-acetyltransferase
MKQVYIVPCDDDDLEILTGLSRRLLEDQNHNEKLTDSQLNERMRLFLHTGFKAYLIKWGDEAVGYALVDTRHSPYSLSQFYAAQNYRKTGMGTLDLRRLIDLLETDVLEVEVNAGNTSGKLFWTTLGFQERSVRLRYQRPRTFRAIKV